MFVEGHVCWCFRKVGFDGVCWRKLMFVSVYWRIVVLSDRSGLYVLQNAGV